MNITYGQIGIILAVGVHAVATVWWAATMTANLRSLREGLDRLNSELFKRDSQIEAIWKRLDELKEKILTGGH